MTQVASETAHKAASLVGTAWSSTTSGSKAFTRENCGVILNIIYTARRNTDNDRPHEKTVVAWHTSIPSIPIFTFAGFDGVGNCKPGATRTSTIDNANKENVLNRFATVLQTEELTSPGILPDTQWIMSKEEFMKNTNVTDTFKEDEQTHYTTPTTAGTLGCAASHIWTSMCFSKSLKNPLTPNRILLVCENDTVPVRSNKFAEHFTQTLKLLKKVTKWDIVLFWRGGEGPTSTLNSEQEEKELVVHTGSHKLYQASFVAGAACYLVSESGANKLHASGFHKTLFCYDDFLNAANAYRQQDHINPRIQESECVMNVIKKGGLLILVSKQFNQTGRVQTLKHLDSANKSDTRYTVTTTVMSKD
eukprot:g3062.t1